MMRRAALTPTISSRPESSAKTAWKAVLRIATTSGSNVVARALHLVRRTGAKGPRKLVLEFVAAHQSKPPRLCREVVLLRLGHCSCVGLLAGQPGAFTIVDDLCADSLGHGISLQGVPAPCKFSKTQRGGKLDRRGAACFCE